MTTYTLSYTGAEIDSRLGSAGTALQPSSLSDLAQTWNDAGTTFTAIKMNVTDTASASDSLLMDLQVGGDSKFKVEKSGALAINSIVGGGEIYNGFSNYAQQNFNFSYGSFSFIDNNGITVVQIGRASQGATRGINFRSSYSLGWTSGNPGIDTDLRLYRDAADTLAQRRGVNPQTFNLYNTYTDGSNYERASFTQTATGLVLDAQYLGTGTEPDNILELKSGGASRFKVDKNGKLFVGENVSDNAIAITSAKSFSNGNFGIGFGNRTVGFSTGSSLAYYYSDAGFGRHHFSGPILLALSPSDTSGPRLYRDASHALGQRNSTNPQTFNLYNTYTDGSNYERGFMKWNSNVLEIGAEALGTGTGRVVKLLLNGATNYIQGGNNILTFFAGGAEYMRVGIGTWSMPAWAGGAGLKIETKNFPGVSDRNGDPIIIDCKGGSGAGTPGYISFKAAKTLASGTTGHTSVEVVRMALNTSDETVITVGSLPTSNPGPGILWNDGGTVKVGT